MLASLLLPAEAGATPARQRDRVLAGADVVQWSPGLWSQSGSPLPLCTTFPTGTITSPSKPTDADSLVCGDLANSWNWTVTVPGGYTIVWGINNLPPGIEVCAQIFYFALRPGELFVEVEIPRDWMVVRDGLGTILYSGSFSGFYSQRTPEVVLTEARRCGLVVPTPPGACCFPDGHCELLPEVECPTGDWRGGVPCDPNPCPQPLGACCLPNCICLVMTAADCDSIGGFWLGGGTSCEPYPCSCPPGACCFPEGYCTFVIPPDCEAAGGQFQGFMITCDPNPCPQPFGACCYPDGRCEYVQQAQCATGDWRVDLTCDPNPCPPPTGACCLVDCSCQVLTAAACASSGGAWMGPGVSCDPNPCSCPGGACCFPDGTCAYLIETQCVSSGGVFYGYGISCDPNPCPPSEPSGACCFLDGSCQVLTEAECAAAQGQWFGDASPDCDPSPCPPPVPAERRSWGQIKNIYR